MRFALAAMLCSCTQPSPAWRIEIGCELTTFYLDEDGDGWGVPEAEELCEAAADIGHTATNALDCDDADPLVTGRTGALCPDDLGEATGVTSLETPYTELLVLHEPTTLDRAASNCDHWGGWLATLPDRPTVHEVLGATADPVLVGAEWDDAWTWHDGTELNLPFCGPEPTDARALALFTDACLDEAPVSAPYVCERAFIEP